MGCRWTGTEITTCDVCRIIDSDTQQKEVTWCSLCHAWLCQRCSRSPLRRMYAAFKRWMQPWLAVPVIVLLCLVPAHAQNECGSLQSIPSFQVADNLGKVHQGACWDPVAKVITLPLTALGGGGTVTHTAGALTLNQLIIGNGAADLKALGSLGTTTTVLHGNAAGPPSFGPVTSLDGVVVLAPTTDQIIINPHALILSDTGSSFYVGTDDPFGGLGDNAQAFIGVEEALLPPDLQDDSNGTSTLEITNNGTGSALTILANSSAPTNNVGAINANTLVGAIDTYGIGSGITTTGAGAGYAFGGQTIADGVSAVGSLYTIYAARPILLNSAVVPTAYSFYSSNLAGVLITDPYYSWFDSQGVRRVKEDATFNSVGQAVDALYNPQFTKYTPGAVNFERVILGQWSSNVAQIGTEAGGTGTLRGVQIIGASLLVPITTATNIIDSGLSASLPVFTNGSKQLTSTPPAGFSPILSGTTGSIGGGLLTVGTCTSGAATVTGAAVGMSATSSPTTYPGDGNYWLTYVSAANTITVKVCATATLTPTASVYNVRVIQ